MPRPGRRAFAAFLLALLSLGMLLIAPASPAAAAPVQIQLLSTNDFHGRLQADSFAGIPGAAKVAGLVDAVSTEAPTSFASAGDNIGASPFVSAVAQDQPTIDVLDEMGLDATAVGNHEFDKGFADLTDRVIPASDYPQLGANVYFEGSRALDAYTVVDVGGIAVGYIGVVTQQTPSLVTPGGIVGLEFRDPVAEAEDVAAELKDGNDANGEADVVVLLAHEGAGSDNIASAADLAADPVFGDFVAMSDDVDVIFSGHTHQPYAFDVPIPGTERSRPIVMASEYGKALGRVKLTVDPDTDTITTDVVELLDPNTATADPTVAGIVQDAVDESAVLGSVQVGTIDADILRAPNRNAESDLANFIADAQLAGTADPGRGDADIAFMNPGGIRDDFRFAANPDGEVPGDGEGVVTYGEAFTVQSFANDVFTKTFTGAQIKEILEQQWQPAGASRPLLFLGVSEGFTYTYDPRAPRGYHVNEGSIMLDGVPVTPEGTYRVTMNSFLNTGGDNFTTLGEGTDPVTTGDNDLTMLVDYFGSFAGPAEVDRDPRTFVAIPEEPDITPFPTVTRAVAQQFADIAGRAPTAEEQYAWEVGIFQGTRTLSQLVLELQSVELRTPAAQVTRLYLGLLGRGPDAEGLAYWVDEIADGASINSVAAFFGRSSEFQGLYGSISDEEFVELMYGNLLGREPDDDGAAFWLGELDRGVARHRVFLLFAESAENRDATAPTLRFLDLTASMLGRTPTGAELDLALDALSSGETTFTEIITAIIASQEYADRVIA